MAIRTWTGGGADNLASTALNWDTGAPGTGDSCVLDGAFPVTGNKNCTWDVTATIASINTTGYSGMVTASSAMTVTGGITFANSTFTHGSQQINIAGSQTINVGTAGNNFSALNMSSSYTVTLTENLTVTGEYKHANGATGTFNGSGKSLILQGSVNTAGNLIDLAGTAGILVNGTASQTLDFNTYSPGSRGIGNSFTLNKTGGTATFKHSTTTDATLKGIWFKGGFTYVQGTYDFTTNSVQVGFYGTQTIDANSIVFYDVRYNVDSATFTHSTSYHAGNILYLGGSLKDMTLNGSTIYLDKSLNTQGNYLRTISGTTTFEWTGSTSGNWTPEAHGTGARLAIKNPMTFNKSGGTITVDDWVRFSTGCVVTYTAGTFDFGTNTVEISGNVTLNINGMPLYDVVWTATNTTTLSSLLTATHSVQSSGATTLAGTGGISTAALTIDSSKSLAPAGNSITLTGALTNSGTFTKGTSTIIFNGTSTVIGATAFNNLTINSGKTVHLTAGTTFSCSGLFSATSCTLDSTSGGSQAILNITGTQSVSGVTATDIDSSGGNFVNNPGGTNSNTDNWGVQYSYTGAVSLVITPTSTYHRFKIFSYTGANSLIITPAAGYVQFFPFDTVAASNKFAIHLLDEHGDKIKILTDKETSAWWEFNRKGGCGQCQIEFPWQDENYLRHSHPNYSVQILIDDELRYSGKVVNQARELASGSEMITLTGYGFLTELASLYVRVTFYNQGIKTIVQYILDNHVVGLSNVTYDLSDIDDPGYTVSAVSFNHTVQDAMAFLAKLAGNIDWGVDRNKKFFFKNYDTNIRHVYVLGKDVVGLHEEYRDESTINVLNVYSDSTFLFPIQSTMSINLFGRREGNLFESALSGEADFVRLATSFLKKSGTIKRSISCDITKQDEFIEKTLPIGAIAINSKRFRERPKYGHVNQYGRNNVKYGNLKRDQLTNVRYELDGGGLSVSLQLEDNRPNVGDQTNRLNYEIKDLQRR